ncbi:MAG: hypothetical protein K0B05_10410 [Bacteroidales bacterium]|nr:hypothetical protein [Bacteroidales bacterium]
MKRKLTRAFFLTILTMMFSCDEPETVVTNIVHPDGSVTRKVEMKNIVNKFDISDLQVPVDSTWIIRDSLEFTGEGDTIWVRRAEKLFENSDEINLMYKADSGYNKTSSRRTEFSRKFKWFNTEYRFAEIIDKALPDAYPVSDFLDQEELQWFYSPQYITDEKQNGPDSLKFRALKDTVEIKTEKWVISCLASQWVNEFNKLTEGRAYGEITTESLRKWKDELAGFIQANSEEFDSLWTSGVLFKDLFGESGAVKYRSEADSAMTFAIDKVMIDFRDYTVRIAMPGRLTGTNGLIDSARLLLWPVRSDYFLAQPYEMWAESKTTNIWAWVVAGLFVLFVLTGLVVRAMKKG